MSDATEVPEHDHTAVSVLIMYIIAGMIVACTALVMLTHDGVNGMPHRWIGVVGAVAFTVAAVGMAQFVKRAH
jgi:hypothetical protein